MSVMTKTKSNPTRLRDYPEVIAAEERLADFHRQHGECVREIEALETELNASGEQDAVKLRAWAMVENRPELVEESQRKLTRLQQTREQLAVLDQAMQMQKTRVEEAKFQARRKLVSVLRPIHAEHIRRHVETVLAAARSAKASQAPRPILER